MAQTVPAPATAASGAAAGKKAEPTGDPGTTTVVVTGQRAALESAQKIKQNSDEIVDSIVADDMKLPDKSVTEVLQRVVGVTIDRTMTKDDPEHFSIEGSGVLIRGLSYVRSELNGHDSFSANGGRSLNFEDVPPELLAGVDVYKSPSAEQIEGGIAGLVNLRTAMPFDFKGRKGAFSAKSTYSELRGGKPSPSYSGMLSDRWNTPLGEFGALVDLAYSESATRTDAFQVEPYYPRTDIVTGKTVWIPKGAAWRTLNFDRDRAGQYAALQWRDNASLDSSLTYFKSKYKMVWNESAIFAQSSPYNITVDDGATYDANGVLQTGVLRDATDGGIGFGADTRVASRKSGTQDLDWTLNWKASDKWSFKTDLQYIRANTSSLDSTVATGVQMPKETLDLSGSMPRLLFDDADRAYLADPANYYWAFTQEHQDRSVASEKAWRADARFNFDHPVLNDLRFGLRLTDRKATTINTVPEYHWAAITQPWAKGWDISDLAYLSDPRFSANTHLINFKNFFNGKVSVPSLIVPDVSLAAGYPSTYALLHGYHDELCVASSACTPWAPASFGTDPAGTNDQRERTQAAYGQLRFGFDDLAYPVDGNVGLRYVHTESLAHGYTVFSGTPSSVPAGTTFNGAEVPIMSSFAQAQNAKTSYDNVLPSLNLRLKADNKLQFRLAFASALTRPDFSQMQAYTTLSQNVATHNVTNADGSTTVVVDSLSYTGTANGNALLKPIKSNQLDLTAEWYFSPTGSLTFAAFDKHLRDIVINQSYNMQLADNGGILRDFMVTGPINGARGTARGFEVAFQTYFNKLPGWLAGLGVQANYTYVDSKQKLYTPVSQAYCTGASDATNVNLNLNGCDTDGRSFGNLPLANLSRNAFNVALMYDQGPVSARVAYNWRSRSLQAVNVNGTNGSDGTDSNPDSATYGQHNVAWGLPTWAGAYGQMDASLFYKLTDSVTLGLEGQNLLNATYKQLMQQHIGMMGRAWFSTGRSYSAQLRYSF